MKICVLGPVVTDDYYGGVAVFDEGLAKGFLNNNCLVFLATDQKKAPNYIENNIPVYAIRSNSLKRIIKKEKPDYIIASLGYAKYLLWFRTTAKKIYFLHGFFKKSHYGTLKSFLAVNYQKLLIHISDVVFSNSHFTKMINNDFYGIKTDAVFHLGVTDKFYTSAVENSSIDKIPHSILFVGKLTKTKGIYNLIRGIKQLTEEKVDYVLRIAGDGIEKEQIQKLIHEHDFTVEFLDRLDQEALVHVYQESEIFISLDPSEPFGIVFLEALLCGCKIVCPITGGQVEYLNRFLDSVAFVNAQSGNSIAEGIKKMFTVGKSPVLSVEEKENLTYKKVSEKMMEYMRGMS